MRREWTITFPELNNKKESKSSSQVLLHSAPDIQNSLTQPSEVQESTSLGELTHAWHKFLSEGDHCHAEKILVASNMGEEANVLKEQLIVSITSTLPHPLYFSFLFMWL